MAIGISCVFLWPNLEDKEKVAEWVLSGRGILPLWGSISVIVISIGAFICLTFWSRSLAISLLPGKNYMSQWKFFGQQGPVLAWATQELAATRLPNQPNVLLVSRHDLCPMTEQDIQCAKDEFFPGMNIRFETTTVCHPNGTKIPCVRLYTGKGYDEHQRNDIKPH